MEITVHGLKTNKKAYLTGRKTEKAYLATVYTLGKNNGGEELWIPKSQAEINTAEDTIDVSQWYFSNVLDGRVYVDQ